MAEDDEGFDFDLDDEPVQLADKENAEIKPDPFDDRQSQAIRNFHNRTQHGYAVPVDSGVFVTPRNELEKFLLEYEVEVKLDENSKHYVYIGSGRNHAAFVQILMKVLNNREKCEEVISSLEMAVGDLPTLELYLTPTQSTCGRQDTIFRAFLLCIHTQRKAFDILMHHTDLLAKSKEEKANQLAQACVAHMRYLERVPDSQALMASIFDREIEDWSPGARDALICALPEVLVDPCSQQEASNILEEMIMRQPLRGEVQSYQFALIGSLRLLRMDAATAKKIRGSLCRCVMNIEAAVIPELVSFVIDTLTVDDKSQLRDALNDFASHLKIEDLRVNRGQRSLITVDGIVLDMFSRICCYVRLEGQKGWKEVLAFLRRGKPGKKPVEELDEDNPEDEQELPTDDKKDSDRVFYLFDILMSFALLSMESCPTSVITNLKNQLTQNPGQNERFMEMCKIALGFTKFSVNHSPAMSQLARQCLWTFDPVVRKFGAFVYKQLFISIDKTREVILTDMLLHLPKSDGEAEAVLDAVGDLVMSHMESILPFVGQIHRCLDLMEHLNVSNIKNVFKILVHIYTHQPQQIQLKADVEDSIAMMTRSIDERHQMWGVLGMVVQLHSHIISTASNRESSLKTTLEALEQTTRSSAWLRSVFYEEMTEVFKQNQRCTESTTLVRWADRLFKSFRKDFFVNRPENESILELESPKFCREETTLWLTVPPERHMEIVPLFQLLKEAALLKQRWSSRNEDTQEVVKHHWNQFFFAFEANISMTTVSTELNQSDDSAKNSADYLYHTIDWIRMILNTFSSNMTVDNVPQEVIDMLWTKKFFLMFECQKQLKFRIKMLTQWRIPTLNVQSGYTIVSEKQAIPKTKRGKKPVKKAAKKRRTADATNDNEVQLNADGDEIQTEPSDDEAPNEDDSSQLQSVDSVLNPRGHTIISLTVFMERLRQLKMGTVVRLILYIPGKRRATFFLLEELLKILNIVLPKREKKVVPWETKAVNPSLCPDYHGSPPNIWQMALKITPAIWNILANTLGFFRADLNETGITDTGSEIYISMARLMRVSLMCLTAVMSCKEVSIEPQRDETDKASRQKAMKRRQLMEKLEHFILERMTSQNEDNEDAECTLLAYLVKAADVVPSIEVAVALLDTVSSCSGWTDELKESMARHALSYLKKEWRDDESNTLKGAQLNAPVKCILDHYIRLRPAWHRLSCIQWLLANKVAELVPDDERRRSRMPSFEKTDDPTLTDADRRALFACFTKATFTGIYKVLFTSLNNAIQCRLMHTDDLKSGVKTSTAIAVEWKLAANSFCLLGLLLRVKELRNAAVMAVAVKEGKRFLNMFSSKGSFKYILDDKLRFSPVSSDMLNIIKSVQLGNRSLQTIGVFAKTAKSAVLLKTLPELRATSELWMRTMHSAMIKLGCHAAFEIGLLKSRDMDGEEIQDQDEDGLDDDELSRDDDDLAQTRTDPSQGMNNAGNTEKHAGLAGDHDVDDPEADQHRKGTTTPDDDDEPSTEMSEVY